MNSIFKRRSIRKYLDKKVEKEKLDKIIEAGIYARIKNIKSRRNC